MYYRSKILVVETDPATLRQFETTLKAMGAQPRCLSSSRQAAELINKEKFDGVFLDWDTPELNGEELTRRIRHSRSNAKVPIAMLTARTDAQVVAEGFKAGVTFFLTKPVGPKELGRLLNASRGAMLQERRRYHRVPVPVPVVCTWGDKQVTGQGVNLSARGLLVSLTPAPAMGTDLSLEFTLPHTQETLRLKGAVVRTGPGPQVAVKLVKLSSAEREVVEGYLSRAAASLPAAR